MRAGEIMELAVSLAGFVEKPADSFVFRDTIDAKRVLFGIDIGEQDLERAKAGGFDLVVAHHPPFPGAIGRVLRRHVDLMAGAGVEPRAAEAAYADLCSALKIGAGDAGVEERAARMYGIAEALGIDFMNVHLPCDELGRVAMQEAADRLPAESTLADLAKAFEKFPEISGSPERVRIERGMPSDKAGRIVVVHAAGTNGGAPVAEAILRAGAGTVVYIHMHPGRVDPGCPGGIVVTGHFGSDSIGINCLIRELMARGMEIETCNGVTGWSR